MEEANLTIEELVEGLKNGTYRNIGVIAGAGISCGMWNEFACFISSIGNS